MSQIIFKQVHRKSEKKHPVYGNYSLLFAVGLKKLSFFFATRGNKEFDD